MGNDNLGRMEDTGLKDVVRTYFDGLNKSYSKETIETYRKVLTTRYGIKDFGKLKQDFKDGIFD